MSRNYLPVLVVFVAWATQGQCQESSNEGMRHLERIVERQSSMPISRYSQFMEPSLPVKVEQVESEWAPCQAVVLAIPTSLILDNRDFTAFYMNLARAAARFTDVIWLVGEDNHTQSRLLEELRNADMAHYFSAKEEHPRMSMIPTPLNSMWVRDFGPVFLRDQDGQVCYADAVYRDVRQEGIVRTLDDVSPVYLANYLRHTYAHDLPSERAPIQLWGGDLISAGRGSTLVSTDTLLMNGGRDDELRLILRTYYGMRQLAYLSPLPGPTVKHLDMVVKVVDDDTILMGDYPSEVSAETDAYLAYLHQEAKRVLEQNIAIVQAKLPHRVVRMPMPPLKRKLLHEPNDLVRAYLQYIGVPMPVDPTGQDWTFRQYVYLLYAVRAFELSPPLFKAVDQIIREVKGENEKTLLWIAKTNEAELQEASEERADPASAGRPRLERNDDDYRAAMERLVDKSIKDANFYNYIYRSYLNALTINGVRGQAILVPSYQGESAIEEEVGRIYRELCPNAKIVFINCDRIIEAQGAIHCVAITVPRLGPQ